MIDATADFLSETKRLLLLDMVWFWLIDIWWGIAGYGYFAMLGTAADLWMWVIIIFGNYWVSFLMLHQIAFVTMVGAATYYFSSNRQQNGCA